MKVHQIACEIGRHIVFDTIVEGIDAEAVPTVPALSLKTNVEIHGLLRLQIGIANPVVAEACAVESHRRPRIHLPVVVELTHARLGIARAKIRLEATVRLPADVVRHADIKGRVRPEKIAVVHAQNRRENGILVDLPCILHKDMLLLDLRRADGLLILTVCKFLHECFSVPTQVAPQPLFIIESHN